MKLHLPSMTSASLSERPFAGESMLDQERQERRIRFTSLSDSITLPFFSSQLIPKRVKCGNSMVLSPLKWVLGDLQWIMKIASTSEVIITPTFYASIQKPKRGRIP